MKTILFLCLLVAVLVMAQSSAGGVLMTDKYILLLAHFDREETLDADYAAGSSTATLQGEPEVVKATYGRGVRIAGDVALTYDAKKNIDFRRGTVEMTVIPEWSSTDAPEDVYLFSIDYPYPTPRRTFPPQDIHTYFKCHIIGGRRIEFQMYDHILTAEGIDWKRGETHKIAFSWDSDVGLALMVDEKVYGLNCTWKPFNLSYAPIVVGCVGKGGPELIFYRPFGGIIDEFRISRVPLIPVGEALVKEKFIEGKPGGEGQSSSLRLIEFYDPEIVESPVKLDYYQYMAKWHKGGLAGYQEDIRILREREKLDEIIEPGRSEYEKQVLLCQWITAQWPHFGEELKGVPSYKKLEAARDGTGGGLCGAFSWILGDCFRSLGWNARYVSVSGHATFEAWSNEFNKWYLMEPDGATLYRKDGIPLSAIELHDLYVKSIEDPNVVDTLEAVRFPFTQGHEPFTRRNDKGLATYSTVRMGSALGRGWYLYSDDYARLEKLPDNVSERHKKIKEYNYNKRNKELREAGRIIENPDHFYWTLNRARPKLAFSEDPNSLKVTLTRSLTPLFKDYVVNIDSGPDEVRPEEFSWPLHSGVNTLEVRTRNEYGIFGHPNRIKIWVPYSE